MPHRSLHPPMNQIKVNEQHSNTFLFMYNLKLFISKLATYHYFGLQSCPNIQYLFRRHFSLIFLFSVKEKSRATNKVYSHGSTSKTFCDHHISFNVWRKSPEPQTLLAVMVQCMKLSQTSYLSDIYKCQGQVQSRKPSQL